MRVTHQKRARSARVSEAGWAAFAKAPASFAQAMRRRGPASAEKRRQPVRGAASPRTSERGWGPASAEKGFTLIELLIVVGIVGVVAAITVPGLLRARMSADEASAVGSIRAINSAEAAYSSATGGGGYAISLAVLSSACPGSPQGFISPDLSSDPSLKSGYTVTLEDASGALDVVDDCNTNKSRTGYYSSAVPLGAGWSGQRGFSSSGRGNIFFTQDGNKPPETGGVPLQ